MIGAHILREVKDTIPATASHGNNESCNSWVPLLALCQQLTLTKEDMISRVRVCGCDPILIPARSTKLVRCSVRVAHNGQSYQALVEEDSTYHPPLQKGLVVCRTFEKVDETGIICIDATNLGGEDLYLYPRTVIGVLKDAYEEPRRDIVDVTTEEVVVLEHGPSACLTEKLIHQMKIGYTIDSEEQDRLVQLLEKHERVFSNDDDDIGYCDAIGHRIIIILNA